MSDWKFYIVLIVEFVAVWVVGRWLGIKARNEMLAASREEIKNLRQVCGNEDSSLVEQGDVLYIAEEQPTVDAVQVVRCKNCQKCSYDEEWKTYVAKPGCPLHPIGFGCARIEPDGYCSRGVRKEVEK